MEELTPPDKIRTSVGRVKGARLAGNTRER